MHDEIGVGSGQFRIILQAGHTDGEHSPGFRGGDAGDGIFDHHAMVGTNVELSGCFEEKIRSGFAMSNIATGNIGREQVEEGFGGRTRWAGDGNARQKLPRIFRGRSGGDGNTGSYAIEGETSSVGKNVKLSALDEVDQFFLFFASVLDGPSSRIGNVEVFEDGECSRLSGFSGDLGLVQARVETIGRVGGRWLDIGPPRLHELVQGLAPGDFMRGIDENAIDIENHGGIRHVAHVKPGLRLASCAVVTFSSFERRGSCSGLRKKTRAR